MHHKSTKLVLPLLVANGKVVGILHSEEHGEFSPTNKGTKVHESEYKKKTVLELPEKTLVNTCKAWRM